MKSAVKRDERGFVRLPAKNRTMMIGLVFAVVSTVILTALWQKPRIMTLLASGDTVTAEFADSYRLTTHDSTVKVAGHTVGEVTKIRYTDRGTAKVTMKVEHEAVERIGSDPTAKIEPRTLLGGRYAIEIHPGGKQDGEFDGHIPLSRTGKPVELDRVLESLPGSTRDALQGLVKNAAPALKDSEEPVGDLLGTAPKVLEPGTGVVKSAQGDHPDTDLQNLVTNLSSTAEVMTSKDGQLDAIAKDLNTTAATLATHRRPLRQTVAGLPETLHSTRSGVRGLDESIVELETTATSLQPSAAKLNTLVTEVRPLLTEVRPLLANLRPVLRDVRPTVRELDPVATRATGVLEDLHGPVLDRVNGPVSSFVLKPWKGTGPYEGATDNYMKDHPFYKELAYMATNVDRGSMTQDSRGSTLAFQIGVGTDSVTLDGRPLTIEDLLELAMDEADIKDKKTRKSVLKKAGVK